MSIIIKKESGSRPASAPGDIDYSNFGLEYEFVRLSSIAVANFYDYNTCEVTA